MTLMREPLGRWFGLIVMTVTFFLANFQAKAFGTGDEPKLADFFGFLPLEIYKLDPRISNLMVKDLDGDKTDDIIVGNNSRSRIEILLSGKSKTSATEAPFPKPEINEIVSDGRLRLQSVPVNKEVVSLGSGDFNGDGKPDLVFQGNPSELVMLFNQGGGRFDTADSKRIDAGDIVESGSALTVGDLDRNGLDDVALLGPDDIVVILQTEKGKFAEPERLPHTCSTPRIMKLVDIDGDGGLDLVILDNEPTAPIHIRFSIQGGKLGPEQQFAVESPRAIAFGNLDKKPGAEILTIDTQSGRARVLGLDESDDTSGGERGRLIFYPLPHGNERGRSLATGDLDGDGKIDVVVTDPANAQFLVYKQGAKGGLETSQSFPGLVGGKTLKLADLDNDGKAEVIVLSEQEKQIGKSNLVDGRLTFPTSLPLSGEPVAIEVADLDNDKAPEILYVSRFKAENSVEYSLRALNREKSGGFVPFRWGQDDKLPLKGVQAVPQAIRAIDANQDGLVDILVFSSFGPPTLLLGRAGGPPAASGDSLAPLTGITPGALTLVDLDGPAMIVSQNSFARNLLLDKSERWDVKEQYNTGQNGAQVLGATAIDTNGDGIKEVVLLDRVSKSLFYLEKKDGVYRPAGSVRIGSIDFQSLQVADLNGDGKDDLLIAGTDRFGVILTGQKGLRLKTLATHESKRNEVRFGDLIVGDLNSDDHQDITLLDVGEHAVEIVSVGDSMELLPALTFKVFERKSFRGAGGSMEPRDLAIGDVDGDGRPDLILLSHDRLLVYRQDSGEKTEEPKVKPDETKPM